MGAGDREQEQRGRQGCTSEWCNHSPAHAGAGKDLETMMGFVEIFLILPCVCVWSYSHQPLRAGAPSEGRSSEGSEQQRLPGVGSGCPL